MKIFLAQPDITDLERKAVLEVLKTSSLSLGPKLEEFERKIAKFTGVKYAVGVNSGTSALHLIIRALEIKKGDEVITTPFSFIASANCILFEGANSVFVDIDPKTLNIDVDKIEKAITKKTKAILAVDVFGHSAEWDKIKKIAKKYKLKLIEDSAEALGAMYKSEIRNKSKIKNQKSNWKKCGSFGDAGVFAFYPNKQITTGEGGVVLTNNKKIANLCRSMANQGRKIKNGHSTGLGQVKWLEHIRLGYNYRMSDINAALGVVQLSRIDEIIKRRKKIASLYNKYLSDISNIKIPYIAPWAKISWFVYVIQLAENYLKKDRNRIIEKMAKKGIQCSTYFESIHLQPFYQKMFGYKKGDFPICENVSERTIALPFYNSLREKEIKFVVKNLKNILLSRTR